MITNSPCWVYSEVHELPTYEGQPKLDKFLGEFESKVPKQQRLLSLEFSLKSTPLRWWTLYKHNITVWSQCRSFLELQFGVDYLHIGEKCNGKMNPFNHINACTMRWDLQP